MDRRTDKQLDDDFDKAATLREQAVMAMEAIREEKSRRKGVRVSTLRSRMEAANAN